jgi:hypothetical protein
MSVHFDFISKPNLQANWRLAINFLLCRRNVTALSVATMDWNVRLTPGLTARSRPKLPVRTIFTTAVVIPTAISASVSLMASIVAHPSQLVDASKSFYVKERSETDSKAIMAFLGFADLILTLPMGLVIFASTTTETVVATTYVITRSAISTAWIAVRNRPNCWTGH